MQTRAVATALPGLTVRRHWGLRFAAHLGALLFAVAISWALFRIVSVEYRIDPITGWYIWASGTTFVLVGTLIFLDREQRANGLLLVVYGILHQLPPPAELFPAVPIWAIFFMALNASLRWILLPVVLLRFPERRLQKRYERIFIIVMAAWLLSAEAVIAVSWPCWATPKNITIWPWWLANCQLSDAAELAVYMGQAVFAAGIISLLTLRILRTRGLDRRIYVPVHIASIFGGATVASLAVWNLAGEFYIYWGLYPGSWGEFALVRGVSVALAVIPVMLLLANIGRRLLKLRIAGMVAEINLARTPDGIQTALRRALADPSLVIHLWSPEQKQYVETDGRALDGDNSSHRVVVDVLNPDGSASARIVADESVAHHPELLRAAREAGGLALHNSALQANLLATIERERSSRKLSETLSHLLPTGLADRLRRDGLRIGQPEVSK